MSPASSGLEVERYIGACLFSQNRVKSVDVNNKNKQFFQIYHQQIPRNHDVWAGGIPLISFANRQKTRKLQENVRQVEDPSSSLARLAVHTQGAPLIVTKTFNHRKNKQNRNPNNSSNHRHTKVFEDSNIKKQNKCSSVNTDTISVTSDESSSSNNSEFSLPRIIKPRKRRKKDRKPLLGRLSSQDGFSTDSTSPEVDGNLALGLVFPFTFDVYAASNAKTFTENSQAFNDTNEAPKLHHAFEDVEDIKDINGNQQTSICQCRYCDPNSQIWDMDKNCYSPFLTHPSLDINLSSNSSSIDCLEHGFSLISLSDEEGNKKISPSRSSSFLSSSDLEVSTEIVTSVHGHRDLEIKFFSTNSESGKKLF